MQNVHFNLYIIVLYFRKKNVTSPYSNKSWEKTIDATVIDSYDEKVGID